LDRESIGEGCGDNDEVSLEQRNYGRHDVCVCARAAADALRLIDDVTVT